MTEATSVVWTTVVTPSGHVISVTSRDGGEVEESYKNISAFLADHEHLTPYHQYRNQYMGDAQVDDIELAVAREAKEKGLVETAEALGGVVKTQLEDGTNYLGLKKYKPKASDVVEGDSYEVMATSYSNDGTKVDFYGSEGQYPVASHQITGTWKETFDKIFNNWEPKEGSKIALTTPTKLYIVCSGAKSTGNPYHNIRSISA